MQIIVGSEGKGIWAKKYINFILKKLGYETIIWKNTNECKFIVSSFFIQDENYWNKSKKPYVYWSGESMTPNSNPNAIKSIYLLSTTETNVKNLIYNPFILHSPHINLSRKYSNTDRKYFLAYCNSNRIPERETIFNLFVMKKGTDLCHALSKCCGNYPETKKESPKGEWYDHDIIDIYKDYTFVIAMENKCKPGYVTEKILNAFYSGAIPIYWGSKNIDDFFNTNAFINANKFNSFFDCVNYVCNMSQEEIIKMSREKIYNESNELINIYKDQPNNKTLEEQIEIFKRLLN